MVKLRAYLAVDGLLPIDVSISISVWSNPGLDIRFVFQNPKAKIAPKAKTTVSQWADENV